MSTKDVADILRRAFPSYAGVIPTRTLPRLLVALFAPFAPALRFIAADIDVKLVPDTAYVTDLTGITFRPAAEAVRAMGQSLIDYEVV